MYCTPRTPDRCAAGVVAGGAMPKTASGVYPAAHRRIGFIMGGPKDVVCVGDDQVDIQRETLQ